MGVSKGVAKAVTGGWRSVGWASLAVPKRFAARWGWTEADRSG